MAIAITPAGPVALEMSNGRLPSDYRKQFGRRVRELREASGLYQWEIAEKMGVNRLYVLKIEKGKCLPGLDVCTKLAHALDMELSDFVWETWDQILYRKYEPKQ
jgi:transcriptional regulator with XRE-family HTH domain